MLVTHELDFGTKEGGREGLGKGDEGMGKEVIRLLTVLYTDRNPMTLTIAIPICTVLL